MKKNGLFGALILLFAALSAIANEYSAGKYSLQVGKYGDFSLSYDEEPLLSSETILVHNNKWQWILFDNQYVPKLSSEQKGDTTVITLSMTRPGVMENFQQTMTLSPNGLEIMYSGMPLCDIFDIESALRLPENIFAGQEYNCRIHTGQTIGGTFPEDRPEKNNDDMCGGFVYNGKFEFDAGILVVETNLTRMRLQNMRTVPKISYYALGWVLRNYPKGKPLQQGYKISVQPAAAE